jgi:predicted S18 family serine protease
MTGEITLRGRVWPIAGLKEKLLAALRGSIKTVLIQKCRQAKHVGVEQGCDATSSGPAMRDHRRYAYSVWAFAS